MPLSAQYCRLVMPPEAYQPFCFSHSTYGWNASFPSDRWRYKRHALSLCMFPQWNTSCLMPVYLQTRACCAPWCHTFSVVRRIRCKDGFILLRSMLYVAMESLSETLSIALREHPMFLNYPSRRRYVISMHKYSQLKIQWLFTFKILWDRFTFIRLVLCL